MLIDKNSLIIWGYKLAPYIVQVKYGQNKVWGSDTGRNLAFSFSGTYGGIVDKLKITFGRLTKEQIELISPILNSASQPIKFYCPDKKGIYETTTYTGDWETGQRVTFSQVAKAGESFDISLIAKRPRNPEPVVPGEFI